MLYSAAFFSVCCIACLSRTAVLQSLSKRHSVGAAGHVLVIHFTVGETAAALSSRSTEGGPALGRDLSGQLMQQFVVMQRGQIKKLEL